MKLPSGNGARFPVEGKKLTGGKGASFLVRKNEAPRWEGGKLPSGKRGSFPVGSDEASR